MSESHERTKKVLLQVWLDKHQRVLISTNNFNQHRGRADTILITHLRKALANYMLC